MTDPLILAYLAGTIDADGSITIFKQWIKNRDPSKTRGRKNDYYTGIVSLSEVHPVVPQLLAETFGGRAKFYPYHTRPKNRSTWQWMVTNRKAAQTAEMLLPYLRLKRRNAEVLIEFQKQMDRSRGGWVSPEMWSDREKLCLLIRSFNTQRKTIARATYEDGYTGPTKDDLLKELSEARERRRSEETLVHVDEVPTPQSSAWGEQ